MICHTFGLKSQKRQFLLSFIFKLWRFFPWRVLLAKRHTWLRLILIPKIWLKLKIRQHKSNKKRISYKLLSVSLSLVHFSWDQPFPSYGYVLFFRFLWITIQVLNITKTKLLLPRIRMSWFHTQKNLPKMLKVFELKASKLKRRHSERKTRHFRCFVLSLFKLVRQRTQNGCQTKYLNPGTF